jgi:hypothetical protein
MQLVIKARIHKYIKKYRGKTGRWEYVYAEGKGQVKKKPQPSPPQRYKQEHLDVIKKYFTPKQVDMIKHKNLVPLTLTL